jgi:vitamin B12 transporter
MPARFIRRSRLLLTQPVALTFVVLASLAGASTAVAAQAKPSESSVSGSVTDPLGARVPGAMVTLLNVTGQRVADTRTDTDGRYTFPRIAQGTYQLKAHADELVSAAIDPFMVQLGEAVVVDVALKVGLYEERVVTAAAIETPLSQVGASVTVIDEGTLEALGKPDVHEALRLVPGTSVVQSGARGSLTSVFVRGGTSSFTKILIDDVAANDIGGAFDFGDVATTGVDRVETLRQANSVLYGSDALTGVISLTTRRGRTRVPEALVSIEGGNFGTDHEDVSLGGTSQQFHYFADFSHFATDNHVPNNAYHNKTFASRVGWTARNGSDLSVTVRHTTSSLGTPNGIDLYGIPDDSSQTADATLVNASFQTLIGPRWQTTVRFGSMDQSHRSLNPSPTGEPFDPFNFGFPNYLGHLVTLTGANGYSVTGQAILDYGAEYPQTFEAASTRRAGYGQATGHLSGWLDVSAGGRVEHEDGYTLYAGSRSPTTRTNAGAFAEARTTFHRTFVTAGVGYDHNAIFKSAVTPRVSAAAYLRQPASPVMLGDTKVTLNAGTGIKAPSIAQELSSLYALVQLLPAETRPAVAGLSPIGPERNRGFDVGVEQELWRGRGRARASFFHNAFSDLIEYVNASVLPQLGIPPAVAGATGYGAYVNASSYTARGFEASGEVLLGRFVKVTGTYTHLHAVVNESFTTSTLEPAINPAFPAIPIGAYAPLVGAAPFRRPGKVGSLLVAFTRDRFQVALAGAFVGKSDDSTFLSDGYFGNSMLLPNHDLDGAYQKLDLSGSYRIHRRLRWYVTVENLLDQRYAAVFGSPALPLSVRTGVTATIGGDGLRRP